MRKLQAFYRWQLLGFWYTLSILACDYSSNCSGKGLSSYFLIILFGLQEILRMKYFHGMKLKTGEFWVMRMLKKSHLQLVESNSLLNFRIYRLHQQRLGVFWKQCCHIRSLLAVKVILFAPEMFQTDTKNQTLFWDFDTKDQRCNYKVWYIKGLIYRVSNNLFD